MWETPQYRNIPHISLAQPGRSKSIQNNQKKYVIRPVTKTMTRRKIISSDPKGGRAFKTPDQSWHSDTCPTKQRRRQRQPRRSEQRKQRQQPGRTQCSPVLSSSTPAAGSRTRSKTQRPNPAQFHSSSKSFAIHIQKHDHIVESSQIITNPRTRKRYYNVSIDDYHNAMKQFPHGLKQPPKR